jgi:DNA polymerase-1
MRWFPHLDPAKFETDREFKSMIEYYKRLGKNHPVQGTSADITKISIVMLYPLFADVGAKLVNTIHDELCVEAPLEHTIEVAKLMKQKMILAGEQFLHKVPVLVDIKIRDSWWKDDGVEDNEEGQQLWLMPQRFG